MPTAIVDIEKPTAAKPASPKMRVWPWILLICAAAAVAGVVVWRRLPLPAPSVTDVVQLTHDGLPKSTVLSDGNNVYVGEIADGHERVTKLASDGKASTLATPFITVSAQSISPDRSSLLASAPDTSGERALWSVPFSGGTPERIPGVHGRNGTWTPDGQHLVFVQDSALYIAKADGSESRLLTQVQGSPFHPRVSPDGSRVRFSVSDGGGNSSLWEVRTDGSDLHPLMKGWHNPPAECCGNWTPDGRYYIFQVTQTNPVNLTTLWALAEPVGYFSRVPSKKPAQLTSGPASFGSAEPDPAKRADIIALGVQPYGEVVKYDSASQSFVPVLSGISSTDMDFSRDGQWVAYVSIPEGTLWRSKVDGSERVKLSDGQAALPRWSPDGKTIAVMFRHSGEERWRIMLIPAQGGTAQEMMPSTRNQVDANWSPDGSHLVFGAEWSDRAGISIFDMKTHSSKLIPGSQPVFSPRWSPDGRYIAALSLDFTKLMLFDFQTKQWTEWLSESAGAVSYPAWSADSKYLYFEDLVTGEDTIRRVKVGENQPERVFTVKGIDRYPGPFGPWSGRAPDGSELFVRDRSSQEVYKLHVNLP